MDAEREVVCWLNKSGLGATAYYDVPSSRPESFLVVEQTGGTLEELVVGRPMLDVQCWAKKRRDAKVLAEGVQEALRKMAFEHPMVFHANVTSVYRDRDMDSGTPRYHVVCELTIND